LDVGIGKGWNAMVEFAAITYGVVASFVFSALHQNEKRGQPHPKAMVAIGYFLVGSSAAISAALCGVAARQFMH
jgi:hypothetical protein